MIGKLSGIIDSFGDDHLLLDVHGVCYLVYASARTLSRLGQKGEAASLLIITQVREDAITLFGFADSAEQQWFKLLTSVQGVGAKVGLSLLSACPAERLATIIAAQDKAALTQADGVGPKLALRILTELKDKAIKIDIGQSLGIKSDTSSLSSRSSSHNSGLENDAVSALTNLGYARADAYQAVMSVSAKANDNEQKNSLETLILQALKELSA